MTYKKIIPCLDCDLGIPGGRVVKGVEFKQIKYAGLPWELAEKYCKDGADEIVMLDITASRERRETMVEVVRKTSEKISVPLTVGGGIKSVDDAEKVFKAGADKVSINTAAILNPDFINQLVERFGSQSVVVAIDAKRRFVKSKEDAPGKILVETEEGLCWYECSIYGGSKFTGKDAIAWAEEVEERGAGEILPTSMDRDGTRKGYDIPLIREISKRVRIPVIASGGCGKLEHFLEVFRETDASAALAASVFHYGELSVKQVKEFLAGEGIKVRL